MIKNVSFFLCLLFWLSACQKQKAEKPAKENPIIAANPFTKRDSYGDEKSIKTDTIILYEDSIRGLSIPFERKEMLPEIQTAFQDFTVTKETGHQDGPDFKMYVVNKNDQDICFFGMDWHDSLSLYDIYIQSPLIKDEYGLKVGDSFQKIKQKRKRPLQLQTIFYHQHVYAHIEGSQISYEINGSATLPDTIDYETFQFTEEMVKDWKIEQVVWRLKPSH